MKLDKQRRLTIPVFFIERHSLKPGKHYLYDFKGKLSIISEIRENDKLLAEVTMDSKNRIIIPTFLKCYVDFSEEIIIYEKDGKIWIENYEKVAE